MSFYILYILLLFPLFSFVILALFNKHLKRNGDFVGIIAVSASFLLSILLLVFSLINKDFPLNSSLPFLPTHQVNDLSSQAKFAFEHSPTELGADLDLSFFRQAPSIKIISFSLNFDRLTSIMLLVVTLVSLLVHIFSLSYMKGDKRYGRYYATLSLFTFSMLGLVLSSNLLFLYIFWELVGLSSYILIGHEFERKEASSAAIKAFLTTRLGDIGMFIGILICYFCIRSLDFNDIYNAVLSGNFQINGIPSIRTIFGICLFIGVIGKSAQFPLHVWLPDAMQGPTPVSALIHAATMVAAGVYLLVRLFFVFDTNALLFIAYTGAFTSLFAATIAVCQDDIKKVLAYSTISQLGLMVLAVGVNSYTSSIFHLTTHAFFKAGLFLGAGAIIYVMHHTQSMNKFGGLSKKFPFLTFCYICFTLSLCGFPFFAGFYSKDLIVGDTLYFYKQNGHFFLIFAAILTTFLTSFYMFRQIFKVFFGEPKDDDLFNDAKKIPISMSVPLGVLALFAIFAGGFNFSWFNNFFNEDFAISFSSKNLVNFDSVKLHNAHHIALISSILVTVLGLFTSFLFFYERKNKGTILSSKKLKLAFPRCYKLVLNKYYIDEIYNVTFIKLVFVLSKCALLFDKYVIDAAINFTSKITNVFSYVSKLFDEKFVDNFCVLGIAKCIKKKGECFSLIQTGNVRDYIFYSFLSLCLIIGVFFII